MKKNQIILLRNLNEIAKDALVAPKINELYSQKSIHIIDKFNRMFKINLIAIVAFTLVFLIVSIFIGIPIMGIIFFAALNILVVINYRLLKSLEKIDKGESSYIYLKSFNEWINMQVRINEQVSRVLYPVVFLSFIIGFWFKDAEGINLGERLVNEILIGFPDIYLVFGIPLIGIVIAVLILVLLVIFGGRIYKWDLNIVYGRVFKKLEELLADIENLKD